MISRTLLNQAKAYLCWDVIENCTIQLVKLQQETAHFLPPSQQKTIIVFYNSDSDFSAPLFLLFHEAGHCLQYKEFLQSGREAEFLSLQNLPTGMDRVTFEEEAWKLGREIFKKFLLKEGQGLTILTQYDQLATQSMQSYQ